MYIYIYIYYIYGLGQNSVAGKKVDTSRFWSIFENSQNCSKSSACPVGVFSMLQDPPKCNIRQQIIKINNCTKKNINPLELRLDTEGT